MFRDIYDETVHVLHKETSIMGRFPADITDCSAIFQQIENQFVMIIVLFHGTVYLLTNFAAENVLINLWVSV